MTACLRDMPSARTASHSDATPCPTCPRASQQRVGMASWSAHLAGCFPELLPATRARRPDWATAAARPATRERTRKGAALQRWQLAVRLVARATWPARGPHRHAQSITNRPRWHPVVPRCGLNLSGRLVLWFSRALGKQHRRHPHVGDAPFGVTRWDARAWHVTLARSH